MPLRNAPVFTLLALLFFSFSSLHAQQHPYLSKGVKTKINTTPFIKSRLTGVDSVGFGDEPGVLWERKFSELFARYKSYDLSGNIKLADGNFLAAGWISNPSDYNVFVKFSKDGTVLWKDSTSDDFTVYRLGLFPASDSGWLTITDRDSVINNNTQIVYRLLKKYDKNGLKKWEQKIAEGISDFEKVVSTDDNGYLIAYYLRDTFINLSCNNQFSGAQFKRISLTKLDHSGSLKWRKNIFEKQGYYYSESSELNLIKNDTTYFLVGGYSNLAIDSTDCWNIANKDDDIFVASFDETGKEKRFDKFGGSKNEYVYKGVLKPMNTPGVLIFISTESSDRYLASLKNDTTFFDTWLVSIDQTGYFRISRVYDVFPGADDFNINAAQLNDTSYVVLTTGVSNTTDDIIFSKIQTDGSIDWKRKLSDVMIYQFSLIKDDIIYTKYLNDETEGYFGRIGTTSHITGSVYYDLNKNNRKDAGEPYANRHLVTSEKNNYSRSSVAQNGWFRNDVDTGSYKTTVKLINDYYIAEPAEKQTTFTSLFQNDTVHFALQPVAGKRDLSINLLPLTPARPGFNTSYKLIFRNNGTDTIVNGAAVLLKDPRVSIVSTVPAATVVRGDSLVWLFAGFKPFDEYSINIEIKTATPPALNNADTLRYIAAIIPSTGIGTDLTPLDDTARLAQVVVGSYDPNDKKENVAGKIPLAKVTTGEDIQYLIRFQNTGTDTAFTVQITDTLDAKLNWNSFQMIAASHQYKINITDGNKITWTFNNINLPDSNRNSLLSNGFISFKIKAKTNLSAGDYFQNKASIYFDYNLPVVTNTATTVVSTAVVTSVRPIVNTEMQLLAMPNPSGGDLYMKLTGRLQGKFECTVVDLFGRVIQQKTLERNSSSDIQLIPLRLSSLSKGVYFIIVRQKEKQWKQQIIIQ